MEKININIIHPTNNENIEIGVPEDLLVGDMFTQLIEAKFLSADDYEGVLKPSGDRKDSVKLKNENTIGESGISEKDTIQVIAITNAGCSTFVDNNLKKSKERGLKTY